VLRVELADRERLAAGLSKVGDVAVHGRGGEAFAQAS
jgi:hypothetical protein